MYIGPSYANSLINPIKFNYFVQIPAKNCFNKYESIKNEIINNIDEIECIIFQCGFGIKSIIIDIFKIYGNKFWMFDIGSSIDYLLGKKTRKWCKKI